MLRRSKRAPQNRGTADGFTVIELMVTVAVTAILTAIAIPALRSFLQNDQQLTQANSLAMSLNAARSEAIKEDVQGGVLVCPSTDGATCNATNWAQGWIVVSSVSGATPVMTVPSVASGTTLTEVNSLQQVTFLSTGMVQAAAAFTMCDSRGAAQARYIQVTAAGRVGSSLGQKQNGTSLTCP